MTCTTSRTSRSPWTWPSSCGPPSVCWCPTGSWGAAAPRTRRLPPAPAPSPPPSRTTSARSEDSPLGRTSQPACPALHAFPSFLSFLLVLHCATPSQASPSSSTPLFPLGLYGVSSSQYLPALRHAGFNAIVPGGDAAAIARIGEAARIEGLSMLVHPPIGTGQNRDGTGNEQGKNGEISRTASTSSASSNISRFRPRSFPVLSPSFPYPSVLA